MIAEIVHLWQDAIEWARDRPTQREQCDTVAMAMC